ncbi:MAG: hypothetical protein JEZ08_01145 [Clostridiales bacterium]|nr:hypothetical protein [Clostridiales bacterium]
MYNEKHVSDARAEGKLEGQIELLDDLLNLVFHDDPDLFEIIIRSRKINNSELIETLRELLGRKDLSDVKKMIMSL